MRQNQRPLDVGDPLTNLCARFNPLPRFHRAVMAQGIEMMSRRLWPCGLAMLLLLFAHASAAAGTTKAYLLRGIFNVSVGLDDLALRLNRMGIATTVAGHGESGAVAAEAIRDYRSGKVRTVILIGHSLGGSAVLSMADELNKASVPIALLIALDAGSSGPVAPNVRRAVNFYVGGAQLAPAPGFRGSLQNINVGNIPGMTHMALQSMPLMHQKMISLVSAARGAPVLAAGQSR
jgi:pimeloyl-ACP methyl ester carboxylesterase